jgi:hypothetical protein
LIALSNEGFPGVELREDVGYKGVFDGDADDVTPFVFQPGEVSSDEKISREGDEVFYKNWPEEGESDEGENQRREERLELWRFHCY